MWLRGILIGAIVYFGFKVLTRIVLPFRQMKKKFEEQVRNGGRPADEREEGEVSVESTSTEGKESKSAEGDYVEFEEVE